MAPGRTGESCNEVCKDHGLVCKDNTLVSNVPKSETEARQFLAHLYPCSLYLGDCGIGFPGGSAAGDLKCWYHNEDTCRISENKGAKNVRCGAVSHLVRRFCYCESPQRRHLAGEQSDHRASNAVDSTAAAAAAAAAASAVTAVDDEDDGDDGAHKHEHFSEVSLAKPRTAPGILVAAIVPMIALLLSFKSGSQDYRIRSIVVLAAICATSSVKMCHAHNWLAQIGGRGKGAGTLCPKRLGSAVQAQVGPGQHFDILFSTGHGGRATFLVVPGHLIDSLNGKNPYALADDYVNNAPEGNNVAMEDDRKRWHLCTHWSGCYGRADNSNGKGFYKEDANKQNTDAPNHKGRGQVGCEPQVSKHTTRQDA